MKTKDAFKIALLNSRRISVKRKIFIVITSLCFLLLSFLFCFYKTFKDVVNSISYGQNDSKIISVYEKTDKYDEYKKIIDGYKNKNIVYVSEFENSLYGYRDLDNNLGFNILRDMKYYTPKVTKGSAIKTTGQIICPERASDRNFDDLKYEELEDLTKMIGKNVTLYFKDGNTKEKVAKTFKLVGTYNADYSYSYNDCYISSVDYDNIQNETKEEIKGDSVVKLFDIYVNKYKNVKEVNDYLNSQGIITSVSEVDDAFVNYSLFLSMLLLVIMIIVLTIILSKFFKSYYQEENYNIALYKALGFNDKSLIKILFFELEIIMFIAMILAIISLIILSIAVRIYLKQFVSFRAVRIAIPFMAFILYYVIISLINHSLIKSDIKNVSKYSVKVLSEL